MSACVWFADGYAVGSAAWAACVTGELQARFIQHIVHTHNSGIRKLDIQDTAFLPQAASFIGWVCFDL
jgi:hypothetical protein